MVWQDDYRAHELWEIVTDALQGLAEVPTEDLNIDLGRLQTLLTDIDGHKEHPHSSLTTAHLTAVSNVVSTIAAALPDSPATVFSAPSSNRGGASPFAQLAQYVRAWPATGSTTLQGLHSKAAQVEASFAALSTRLGEQLGELQTQNDERSEEMSELVKQQKSDLEEQRAAFAALIEEQSTALREDLDELSEVVAETKTTIEQQKTRLDTALTSHQEKFSAAQEDRTERWVALLADNEAKLQEHLAKMQEHEERSQNVLSAVGVNSTATNYGAYANAQAKAANKWRIGAVIALSVAALAFLAAAGASLLGYGTDLDWWQVVLQKLGAPVGAAAVGYVLIRESGQHRKEERSARQVQLTLTALEPFIANLPEKQKELIRVETARRIFAEQHHGTIGSTPEMAFADDTPNGS